ncbi:MAG TPA: hypothetical protein VGC35_05865 [Allosphingosinicella sp.]|jgi:hypothetical protein
MSWKNGLCLPALLALSLQGCTSLRVTKAGPNAESRRGIAYYLPFTQFETKVTWSPTCEKETTELKISPSVESTPKTGPDPDGLYVIDYDSLSAFTKTSSVKVDFYDSGAIKSINASADDKTGEIASSVITAAAKLAKIAFIGAGTTITCSTELIEALKVVKDAKDRVETKTGELKLATDTLNAYSARMTREGTSVTDAMRSQHSKLIGNVVALQMELEIQKAELEEVRKGATYVKTVVFPENSGQVATDKGLMVPEETLRKWMFKEQESQSGSVARSSSVWLDLKTARAFNMPGATNGSNAPGMDEGGLEDGIRYRVSVPGNLRFCKGGACGILDKYEEEVANGLAPVKPRIEFVKAMPIKILQQGTTFYLPFRSRAFTNGTLSATFAESGVMTSAGYEQKRAPGEALAALGGTLADQATSLYDAAKKDDLTDLQKLEEATKIAEAKKKLEAAEAALVEATPDPDAAYVASLTSETAIKAAELANFNARIAVAEARKKLAEAGGS